jgi:hypothetical protein
LGVGDTDSHQITVKVKSIIPQTPRSQSDPAHFDMVMTNVYGNAVNIKLPGSPSQVVAATATTLPNAGPGTTMLIASMIVMTGGYFYSRARLLSTESLIAIQENATA